MAAILLAEFDGLFRTGRLFSLTVGNTQFVNGGAGVRLDSSKTLQQSLNVNALSEAVVIECKLAIKLLFKACKGRPAADLVLNIYPAYCLKISNLMNSSLKLQRKSVSIVSGGRGQAGASCNATRWQNTASAEDGLIPQQQESMCKAAYPKSSVLSSLKLTEVCWHIRQKTLR